MNWLDFIINTVARIPFERALFSPRDNTKALEEFIDKQTTSSVGKATSTAIQEPPKAPEIAPQSRTAGISQRVSDKDTLLYQLNHLVAALSQLEIHLSEGCKIMGVPCDCCKKHSIQARTFAMETISIAARMGKPTAIYNEIATWAPTIEAIDTPEKVESGDYDETYRKESGTASQFRKTVQSMIGELKGEEDCPSCEEMRESISSFIEQRKRKGIAELSPEDKAKILKRSKELIEEV
ncbi:MAG: hypothetical protein E3J60_00625 [Dehalococcoidia bacterium]|nr:MAG: hypothetical protein E3J60_00625 [Dehalococcoidia bacterium]